MITISDGIFNIPECERFIGFTGDNNHTQKKFLIRQNPESGWLYRLYLTFDDGRHNFFTLPAKVCKEGTLLEWNIQEHHILKSGLVKAQIKAFSEDNEVYHTTSDVFVAGKTAEEDEEFKNSNSEFIAYEKNLNDLYRKMMKASAKMPRIGENGNWWFYDETKDAYIDSGISSVAVAGNKSITPEQLDRPYWERKDSIETQVTSVDDLFETTGFVGYGGSIAFLNVNMTVNIGEDTVELTKINGFCYAVGVKFVNGDTVYLSNVTDGTNWKINRYNEGSELVPVYRLQCFRLNVVDGTVTPEKLDRKYLERCVTEYGETIKTFAELFEKVGRINRGGNLGFVNLWVSDNENDTINNYGYLDGEFMAVGTLTSSDICLINLRSGENWTVSRNEDNKYFAYKVDALTPRVEYLERELAKQSQLTPQFANSTSECTDTTKLYVLPDGYIYAYLYKSAVEDISYTNLAKESDVEITDNKRVKDDGLLYDYDGNRTVRFIPVSQGDVIHVKGINITRTDYPATMIVFYDENKATVGNGISAGANWTPSVSDYDESVYIYNCFEKASEEQISNAKYIAFHGTAEGSLDDVVITKNENISASVTPAGYQWANTGHAFVPADYEDRIVCVENTNEANTTELSEHAQKLSYIESNLFYDENAVPEYWEDHLAKKCETVKSIQTAGGKDCVSFVWGADTHIAEYETSECTKNLGKIMNALLDTCEIPFAVISGDIYTQGSMATMNSLELHMKAIKNSLSPLWATDKLLMCLGNHDGAWGQVTVDDETVYYRKQLSPDEMWQRYFRGQALDFKRVFGEDGLYFYVDNVPQKTRFIVLNSHFAGEYEVDENGFAVNDRFNNSVYGQAQLDWLSDVLLDMPEGFGAVIVTHVPPTVGSYGNDDKSQLRGIINAYCNKQAFSGTINSLTEGWNNSTVNVDFSDAKGEIIAVFAGHIHKDSVDTTSLPCPVITLTTTGAGDIRDENAPTRTVGTDTEVAFDVVSINKTTRTIKCTRIGAGEDRVIGY